MSYILKIVDNPFPFMLIKLIFCSADDRDEDDDYGKSETDSDEAEYRSGRHGPVRRSTRARVARYDRDFSKLFSLVSCTVCNQIEVGPR